MSEPQADTTGVSIPPSSPPTNPPPTNAMSYALQPGEGTSEHATMKSASFFGKLLVVIGSLTAMIPGLQATLSNSPIADTKQGQYALVGIGAVLALGGLIHDTKAKLAYIDGRSLIKAAAVRDAANETVAAPPAV